MKVLQSGVPVRVRLTFVLLCLYAAQACGTPPLDAAIDCDRLLPGDLVISEVMANPKGLDVEAEWFEVFNATLRPVDMAGIVIENSRTNGTGIQKHRMTSHVIEPGQYAVLGQTAPADAAHDRYAYGMELGELRNDGGAIGLRCGGVEIDRIVYQAALAGVARAFDGKLRPDAFLNDDLDRWCDAEPNVVDGERGTPGQANSPCAVGAKQLFCAEADGSQRRVADMPSGSLVITEFLPDPKAVADEDGEWIEIFATADLDLNGLQLAVNGKMSPLVQQTACMPVSKDTFVVFARSALPTENGRVLEALPANFSLPNTSGVMSLLVGEQTIDTVVYEASKSGVAWSLDRQQTNAVTNDLAINWCPATTPFGLGDLGTPGAENPFCPAAMPAGHCIDGDLVRPIRTLKSGDLVITEFMPNPDQVADSDGEWIEVFAKRDVDLNGLVLARDTPEKLALTLDSVDCLPVGGGSYLLLARKSDPTINGGLPKVDATFATALLSGNSSLWLLRGQTVVDNVSYTSSRAGVALQLSDNKFSATENDNSTNWCDATTTYGDGDFGTPGMANRRCPAAPGDTAIGKGWCYAGGNTRETWPPALGDLAITEIMADPHAKPDTEAEWFEVFVESDLDLNGIVLSRPGAAAYALDTTHCLPVAAGGYAVFAHVDDIARNGGLPFVSATFPFSLPNSGNNMSIALSYNDTILDEVAYAVTERTNNAVWPGIARQLHGDTWCNAATAYGAGDKGTPGETNPPCP